MRTLNTQDIRPIRWTRFGILHVIYEGLGAILCPGMARPSSLQAEFRMLEDSVLFLISDNRVQGQQDGRVMNRPNSVGESLAKR